MPLRVEIEQQETLERNQIKGGLEKIRKDTLHLEKKEYASATVYGSASIATLLPTFIEFINLKKQERIETIKKHGAGSMVALMPYLLALDTESQAVIAAKLTFDKVFSPRRKNQLVVSVTDSIGSAIEAECQMQYYENIAPPLFAALKETYWHQAKGTEYKRKSMQTIMNKHDIIPWNPWSREWKVKLGGFLLNCLARSSGWFESVEKKIGNKSDAYVITTDEFNKHKEEIVRITELF